MGQFTGMTAKPLCLSVGNLHGNNPSEVPFAGDCWLLGNPRSLAVVCIPVKRVEQEHLYSEMPIPCCHAQSRQTPDPLVMPMAV